MPLRLLFLIAILAPILAAEDMETMLKEYAQKSDLSEETKKENIGQLILYTRSDLDRMQARNLKDVIKQYSFFGYTENRYANTDLFSTGLMPSNSSLITVYIDNQEVASGLQGSGYSFLGNIELDFVDHIEIYKTEPSYSFTAEPSFLVLRLYSKSAERDEGGALSLRYGSRGTNLETLSYAKKLESFSYYAYGSHVQENRDSVDGNLGTELRQDKKDIHLFATLQDETNSLQIHYLNREQDAFAGVSPTLTPLSNDIESDYLHIGYEKAFSDDLSLTLTYDRRETTFDHLDMFPLTGLPMVSSTSAYALQNQVYDQVITAKIEHHFRYDDHDIVSGLKYRDNQFGIDGSIGEIALPQNPYDEQQILTFFIEDEYDISEDILMTMGIKYASFHNNGDMTDKQNFAGHLGLLYAMPIGTSKIFINYDVIPVAPWIRINPLFDSGDLEDQKMFSATYAFSQERDSYENALILRYLRIKDFTYMRPDNRVESFQDTQKGYVVNLYSKYRFDADHELQSGIDYNYLDDSMIGDHPVLNGYLRLLDTWGKIRLFNELFMRDNFTDGHKDLSLDYSAGVQYQASETLSFSFKGENIFNDSRLNTSVYGNDPLTNKREITPYQTIQQTFLVQVKYLF